MAVLAVVAGKILKAYSKLFGMPMLTLWPYRKSRILMKLTGVF